MTPAWMILKRTFHEGDPNCPIASEVRCGWINGDLNEVSPTLLFLTKEDAKRFAQAIFGPDDWSVEETCLEEGGKLLPCQSLEYLA